MIELRPTQLEARGLDAAAGLLRRRFPRAPHLTAAYLGWTYRDNPDGRACAWDAWERGSLVAHVSATPMRARLDGAEERAVLIQHVVTERGFEGRGLFKALVERALEEAVRRGFGHAIGIANANSRFALTERLHFASLGALDVRIGVGARPYPSQPRPAAWERIWEPGTLAWRLARPDRPYRARLRRGHAQILCASGVPGILADLGVYREGLVPAPPPAPPGLAFARVWLGLDPDLDWRGRAYLPLPAALRPAPLHVVFRDLGAARRRPDAARLRIAALDFDAY